MSAAYNVTEWRRRTKKRLCDGFGGKCMKCGYCRCVAALHFHHIDPATKKFSISSALANNIRGWDVLVEEVKKCVLLCNRCHTELHSGIWNLLELPIVEFQDFYNRDWHKMKKTTITCKECGCEIVKTVNDARKFCSSVCAKKNQRKVLRPNKDVLSKDIQALNWVAIGRKYGVSDNAVRKWAKGYDSLSG
jgi:hypothetical protein